MSNATTPPGPEVALESWKAIASYLNRDIRTVMRWEKAEALPVRRHRHLARSSVYAYPSELDRWRANRSVEPLEPAGSGRHSPRLLAAAATFVLSLLSAGGGRFDGPLSAMQDGPIDRPANFAGNAWMAPSAALSPDGRYVSYIAAKRDSGDLHIRDLQTGRDWRLTRIMQDGGFADYSAISHDSKFVAVVAHETGRVRRGVHLLLLSATDTPPARVLAEGRWAVPKEWTADDARILALVERDDRRSEIGFVTVADGAYRSVKTFDSSDVGYHVRLSPDGAFIGYDRRTVAEDRQRDVFLIPSDGGSEVALIDDPSSDSMVGWSRDGRHVLFRSDRMGQTGLWAVPVANGRRAGAPVLVHEDFRGDPLSLTAAGALFYERQVGPANDRPKSILYTATVDPVAGSLVKAPWFAAHDRHAFSRFPRWSADGRSFIHITVRPAGLVLSIHAPTGVVSEVPLKLGYIWNFDWAPDARSLIFRATDLAGVRGLYLVDPQSGDIRVIAQAVPDVVFYDFPQFTRDGRAITYFKRDFVLGRQPGRISYVERDLATGVERDVHPDLAELMKDRYPLGRSPDGRYLMASGSPDPKSSSLAVYDTSTRQIREVFRREIDTAFNHENGLQWLPDSRALVVNTRAGLNNERELWFVPVDGRPAHIVDVGTKNLVTNAIAIHPDGRQIAFLGGAPAASKTTVFETEFRLLENVLPK